MSSNPSQSTSSSPGATTFVRPSGAPVRAKGATGGSNGSIPSVVFPDDKTRRGGECFVLYKTDFHVKGKSKIYDAGVYHHFSEKVTDPKTGAESWEPRDEWILSVLEVKAVIRNENGTGHSFLIDYIAHGESHERRLVLSQSLLLGKGDEVFKTLRDKGVSVLNSHTAKVRKYLDLQHERFSAKKPSDFWTSVKVVGWHNPGHCFVLPSEVIGDQDRVWFSGECGKLEYGKQGELKEWKREVAGLCVGNAYLTLAVSCSFSGPLLEPLNLNGLGFHYFGDSTSGKSSAGAVASSVWGPTDFMQSWKTTLNGLENIAASRSGTAAILDETLHVDAKTLDAAVYLLLNGVSKKRMNRDASAREIEHWRLCVLSTGEHSVEAQLRSARINYKAGQGVRIIDIPVTGSHGLFDDLHGHTSARAFSDQLRGSSGTYYGVAGVEFVKSLMQNYDAESIKADFKNVLKDFGSDLSAQEGRVATSFAAVALAGELAIKWGILPWEKRSAILDAMELFNYWRGSQSQSGPSKEHSQIIGKIADCIEKHSSARFSNINWSPTVNKFGVTTNEETVHNRLGYWEDRPKKSRGYLFTSGGLKEATCEFDFGRVLKALEDSKALYEKGSDSRAKSCRTPSGEKIKLYHIDPEKLGRDPMKIKEKEEKVP